MFRKANYRVRDAKNGPQVVIDLRDGFSDSYSERDLVGAIKNIEQKRAKYKSEAEWLAALAVYRGALEFLRRHVAKETA